MVMPASVDYTEAAAVINAALAEGRSATAALTEWSGRPFSTVTNWVHKCRQLGLVPPATKGHRLGAVGNGQRVLACDDCDFECEVHRPNELIRHCVQVHRRQPTRAERTPARAPGSVAS